MIHVLYHSTYTTKIPSVVRFFIEPENPSLDSNQHRSSGSYIFLSPSLLPTAVQSFFPRTSHLRAWQPRPSFS